MPKATLVFILPEEQEQFDVTVKADGLYFTLWDLDQWLRNKIKYGIEDLDPDTLQKVREELHGLLDIHTVNLEMMS